MEDLVNKFGGAPKQIRIYGSIRHKSAGLDLVAGTEDRRQSCAERKSGDARAVDLNERIFRNVKRVRLTLEKLEKWRFEIFRAPDLLGLDADAQGLSHGLNLAHMRYGRGITAVKHDCQP